jgi:hypothetical protein
MRAMRIEILLPAGVAVALTFFAAFFFLRSADGAEISSAPAFASGASLRAASAD